MLHFCIARITQIFFCFCYFIDYILFSVVNALANRFQFLWLFHGKTATSFISNVIMMFEFPENSKTARSSSE